MAKAETHARRALEVRECLLMPDHPDIARSLLTCAVILRATGRDIEADAMSKRADSIYRRLGIVAPLEPSDGI